MNLYPLLDDLRIQDRSTGVVGPWHRNWAQDEYIGEFHRQWNQQRPVRMIVLKARQLGISTATGGIGFCLVMVIPDYPGLIIAHEMDGSEHLLGITRRYYETADFSPLFATKYISKKHLAWKDNNSSIQVVTAKNEAATRSRTLRYVHCSEVGFWDNARTLMLGMKQTVPFEPHTFMALESTANGIGNYFYKTWNEACNGQNEYVPMFFPWWRHYEYRASYARRHFDAMPADPNMAVTSWTMLNAQGRLKDMSEEEKQLERMMLLGHDGRGRMDNTEVLDALIWRRWAIVTLAGNNVDDFHQEYPSFPEEAFIASGSNVFPFRKLLGCYDKKAGITGRLTRDTNVRNGVRFQPDPDGPLTVFSYPSDDREWGVYFGGADPTGTTRGDMACIQIINRRDYRQVARWRGRIDPGSFAEEIAKLGNYYNQAMVAPEATGPGTETIGRLIQMPYPHVWRNRWADRQPGILSNQYGFNTTVKTKEWWVGHLLKLVVDGDVTIHDAQTFSEMQDYVTLDGGGYGPADEDGYDDTVAALAIACLCASTESPLPPYGTAPLPSITPSHTTVREAVAPEFWYDREDEMEAAGSW